MTVPNAYQQSGNRPYQMEKIASDSSSISKISAKRLFFQLLTQKILANTDKIVTSKILPEPLQNRGSRVRILLPLTKMPRKLTFPRHFFFAICSTCHSGRSAELVQKRRLQRGDSVNKDATGDHIYEHSSFYYTYICK